MTTFLKSLNKKSWKSVIVGWSHPQVTNAKGEKELKPKIEWSEIEDGVSLDNSHAFNTIFNGVDKNILGLSMCVCLSKKLRTSLLLLMKVPRKLNC